MDLLITVSGRFIIYNISATIDVLGNTYALQKED